MYWGSVMSGPIEPGMFSLCPLFESARESGKEASYALIKRRGSFKAGEQMDPHDVDDSSMTRLLVLKSSSMSQQPKYSALRGP